MNMGNSENSKKSVFGFVKRGMQKIGLGSIFGDQQNIIRNLRKNSKSERIILTSQEILNESDLSPEESDDNLSNQSNENQDFSREIEM